MNTKILNPDKVIDDAQALQTLAQEIANSANDIHNITNKVKSSWTSDTADVNSYVGELDKLYSNIDSVIVPAINKLAVTAIDFANEAKSTSNKSLY